MQRPKNWAGTRSDTPSHSLRAIIQAPIPTQTQILAMHAKRRDARQRIEELRDINALEDLCLRR